MNEYKLECEIHLCGLFYYIWDHNLPNELMFPMFTEVMNNERSCFLMCFYTAGRHTGVGPRPASRVCMPPPTLSGYCGFLPQSEDMQDRFIGNSKWPIGESEWLSVSLSALRLTGQSVACISHHVSRN